MNMMFNAFHETQKVAMEALTNQVASQNRTAENVAKAVAERPSGGYGRSDAETVSALMGVDFKSYLPTINDSEPD